MVKLRKYSKKKSLKKALRIAGSFATGILAAVAVLPQVDDPKKIPITAALAALIAGIEYGRDYYNQNKKAK